MCYIYNSRGLCGRISMDTNETILANLKKDRQNTLR